MFVLEPCSVEFAETAPHRFENVFETRASPMDVFEAVTSIDAEREWFPDFSGARWIERPAGGVGSIREYRLTYLRLLEHFIVWEPGRRVVFWVSASSLPLTRQFLEDYRLEALPDGRTRLTWRVCYRTDPRTAFLHPLLRPVFARDFRTAARRLRDCCERAADGKKPWSARRVDGTPSRALPVGGDLDRLASAGALLGAALADDPAFVSLVPDPEERREHVAFIQERLVASMMRLGHVYAAADEGGGLHAVALFVPPDRDLGTAQLLRGGFARLPSRLGPSRTARLWRLGRLQDAMRRKHLPAPHWFLQTVGVEPGRVGQGLGSAFLGHLLESVVSPTGCPTAVCASNERTLRFYRRLGFEVAARELADGGRTPVWLLTRPR